MPFRQFLHAWKLKAREILGRKLGLPEIPFALERLARAGFRPELIFDVGAYQGWFARRCLQFWPKARTCCFEPLAHRVKELDCLASRNPRIQVFPILLGAEIRDAVPLLEDESSSSLYERHGHSYPVRQHPMRTVDSIVEQHCSGRAPDLLKLDVQGSELAVLKGAQTSLSGMQLILAEVNFIDIYHGAPLVAELMKWLHERTWVPFDICGLIRREGDGALWQADMMFVPQDSPLRR